jgi:3-hydroxybutyryl-CoA dehydrogenase
MKSIRTIAICGAGQMGVGVSLCFQRAGYRTFLWTREPGEIPTVRETLSSLKTWMQEHLPAAASTQGLLDIVTDLPLVDQTADVIVDCISELLEEKADLFRRLPSARKRQATFLTTTSGLSITQLGQQSGTKQVLVGTHFWNPPHLMPLVEVIRGQDTEDEVVDRVVDLIHSIGKIPVRVNRDLPGFIGNRLLHAMWREAINIVQRGIASPEDVDRTARLTFGLRMPAVGPLENMDLVGLDLVETIHQYLLADLAADRQPLPLLSKQVKRGQLGVKSGRGFYDWKERDSRELIERRNRQIVHQLEFLRKTEPS